MNVFLVILNGSLLTMAVAANALLIKSVGKFSAIFILNLVGFLLIGFYFFVFKKSKMVSLSDIPKYLFLSGALGIISTMLSSLAALHIGTTIAVAAMLSTRIITAGVVDNYGFFERERRKFLPKRLMSFALMFAGILIMVLWKI
jgi:transporter family-2 protein